MSISTGNSHHEKVQRANELLDQMEMEKTKWDKETAADATDELLSKAIELAIQQGRGWKEGEKEEYMRKIGLFDDDYLPPIFATCQEDLDKSGMKDAFTSLMYDDPPAQMMLELKKKGNAAFQNGKNNVAKNMQYFRDAVNHYYEAIGWADKVEPGRLPTDAEGREINNADLIFTNEQLADMKSNLYANASMAHLQLKNWGHVRDDSKKALEFNKANIKAWYRLAKAYQMLQNWEDAGDAIEAGLAVDTNNTDLINLQRVLDAKVLRARSDRQKRERARAERVANVKRVWKYCKDQGIRLGRLPLVSSVTDDDTDEGTLQGSEDEQRWHHHYPHTGKLPTIMDGSWTWPVMFLYPSHKNSDFIEHFAESDMLALRMAQIFPERDEDDQDIARTETSFASWDYNNEFRCSNLAVYFEVHCTEDAEDIVHPDYVELLKNQSDAMRFYESSRALKGDEGEAMAEVARCVERKHLHNQRKMVSYYSL
jgi:tetratricopeptide (TPR) repeat protein